jgi:hypothetical protein
MPALFIGQWFWRVARTVGELRDGVSLEPALAPKHAKQHCARRVGAHKKCARRPSAQRVVDKSGNGRAVTGAGKAMGLTPRLERVGGRMVIAFDGGEHLDGRSEPRGGRHDELARMRTMKISHITIRISIDRPKTAPRTDNRLMVTWTQAWPILTST